MKFLFSCFVLVGLLHSSESAGQSYKDRERVGVVASKIGPYFNPSETYPFWKLAFCEGEEGSEQSHNLGEILAGDRKMLTGIEVLFKVPVKFKRLCRKILSVEDVRQFHLAIDQDYYYELSLDGFLVWGYVGGIQTPSPEAILKRHSLDSGDAVMRLAGELEGELAAKKFLYTHQIFSIAYNGDRIIEVNITAPMEHRLDITKLQEVQADFTYEVVWKETDATERIEHYQKTEFLPATFQIRWFSIFNSFLLVVLLTGYLAVILMRVVKNDFTQYMQGDDEEEFGEDEPGWKLIHGDVFRFPPYKMVLAAVLGAGTHLLFTSLLLILLVITEIISPEQKGTVSTFLIVLYALTAGSSGFVSCRMYLQMGGKDWVWCTILTAIMFPAPLFAVFVLLNSVAIYFGSSAALPFGTIVAMFSIYLLVTFPLTVLGAIIGKRNAKPLNAPCRTNKVKRQIPDPPPFRSTWIQMLVAGFPPFSSIYIELHFVFNSIWGHRVYTLFGILSLAFLFLLVVTCFITVALIYFQLTIEDYRWWWRSVLYGGATSLFVFGHGVFYYFQRSAMNGLLQTSFFFGQMLVISWAFFLILGTVGFFSSFLFVKTIYSYLKLD